MTMAIRARADAEGDSEEMSMSIMTDWMRRKGLLAGRPMLGYPPLPMPKPPPRPGSMRFACVVCNSERTGEHGGWCRNCGATMDIYPTGRVPHLPASALDVPMPPIVPPREPCQHCGR